MAHAPTASPHCTDYAEMIDQFGFVTLFFVAFPLGPGLAFLNNLVEPRVDAFKLCFNFRRAEPKLANGIGTWHYFLQACGLARLCAENKSQSL